MCDIVPGALRVNPLLGPDYVFADGYFLMWAITDRKWWQFWRPKYAWHRYEMYRQIRACKPIGVPA